MSPRIPLRFLPPVLSFVLALTVAVAGARSLVAAKNSVAAVRLGHASSSAGRSLFPADHAAGSRCYVNAAATGGNDGSSWAGAYVDLQSALLDSGCAEIWVAKGVYKPTSTGDQTIYFDIHPGVAVYGGFAGNEITRDARDAKQNLTVLSGDIDGNDAHAGGDQIDLAWTDIAGNNSWHIVVMDATTAFGAIGSDTVLDGFTITGGGVSTQDGGGLFCAGGHAAVTCSPTLTNLLFSGNLSDSGAAIMMLGATSPSVFNTTFRGNHAGWGGAIFIQPALGETSEPRFVDVTFSGNSAEKFGGAIYNSTNSGTTITHVVNATFTGNSAVLGGGAVFNDVDGASGISFLDTILWGDTAPVGAEIDRGASSAASFRYSIVQGSGGSANWNSAFGSDGGGNLDADPKLGPLQDNGGWTPTQLPQAGSAAIDTGGDSCSVADQRGVGMAQGVHCDIGAVEVKQAKLSVITSAHGIVSESAPPAALGGNITNCTSAGGYGCFAFYSIEPDASAVGLRLMPDNGYATASVTTSGCDGGLSGNVYTTAALAEDCTVTVTFSQNVPPIAHTAIGNVAAGSVTPIALSGSDGNSGGPYTFTYAIATPPVHGSVSLSGNVATYTAADDYLGNDSFTFTVSDANGTSVPAFVAIAVRADETTTSLTAAPNPATVNQSVTMSVVVTNILNGSAAAHARVAADAVPAATAPSGSAVVSDGTVTCTAAINNGSGSCALSFATPGTRTLTATFTSSDPAYAASSTTTQLVVAAVATSATVAAPSLSCWALVLLGSLILLVVFRCGTRRLARRGADVLDFC